MENFQVRLQYDDDWFCSYAGLSETPGSWQEGTKSWTDSTTLSKIHGGRYVEGVYLYVEMDQTWYWGQHYTGKMYIDYYKIDYYLSKDL